MFLEVRHTSCSGWHYLFDAQASEESHCLYDAVPTFQRSPSLERQRQSLCLFVALFLLAKAAKSSSLTLQSMVNGRCDLAWPDRDSLSSNVLFRLLTY